MASSQHRVVPMGALEYTAHTAAGTYRTGRTAADALNAGWSAKNGPRRLTLALALVLASTGPVAAGTGGDIAIVAAAGADLYSTQVALNRGGLESNPVAGTLAAQALLKVGVSSVAIYQSHRWEREGHRNRARVLRWSLVAIWGGAATWNLTRGGR